MPLLIHPPKISHFISSNEIFSHLWEMWLLKKGSSYFEPHCSTCHIRCANFLCASHMKVARISYHFWHKQELIGLLHPGCQPSLHEHAKITSTVKKIVVSKSNGWWADQWSESQSRKKPVRVLHLLSKVWFLKAGSLQMKQQDQFDKQLTCTCTWTGVNSSHSKGKEFPGYNDYLVKKYYKISY